MKKAKNIIDIILYILLLVCMGYQVTGNLWHEIVGIGMFVVFIVHLILNGYWFTKFPAVAKNSFSSARGGICFLTDILLLIDMIVLAVTSVAISKSVFVFLSLNGGRFAVWLHTFCAYLGLILISVHIGVHWKGILHRLYRLYGIDKDRKAVKLTNGTLALLIAFLGVYSSFHKGVGKRLLYNAEAAPVNTKTEQQLDTGGTETDRSSLNVPPAEQFPTGDGAEKVSLTQVRGGFHGHGDGNGNGNGQQSGSRSFSEEIGDGESLDDFLGRLVCTGCGKQCPLSSPQCGTGTAQAQQAAEYYQQNSSEDSQENGSGQGNDFSQGNGGGFERKLRLSGDENLINLFTDFMPITGLYIAGTYYLLEIIERKKREQ